MLFGINVGGAKAWFEYDGTMQFTPTCRRSVSRALDENNNVVTIVIPQAQVLGVPDAGTRARFPMSTATRAC